MGSSLQYRLLDVAVVKSDGSRGKVVVLRLWQRAALAPRCARSCRHAARKETGKEAARSSPRGISIAVGSAGKIKSVF